MQLANSDATITITTRDFKEKGIITLEDGVLTWGETKADRINSVIGQIIAYPRATDTRNGYDKDVSYDGTWRVFYADNKQMFIIPTGIAEKKFLIMEPNPNNYVRAKKDPNGNEYSGSDDVFAERTIGVVGNKKVTYGLTYNSRWKEKLGSNKDTLFRSKATAYLCDPANWTRYLANNAPDGTYAVGGPTRELIIAVWEATGRSAKWADRSTTIDVEPGGYVTNKPAGVYDPIDGIYPIRRDILETEPGKKDGLLNNGYSYWLASPVSQYHETVSSFYVGGQVSGVPGNWEANGLRPLVSIPLSHVNVEYDKDNDKYVISLDFVEE